MSACNLHHLSLTDTHNIACLMLFVLCRFRFFIDDQFAADGFTSYNELNLFMTLNVTTASHTLRIAKMNDGSKGEAVLQSISIAPSGRYSGFGLD